MSFRSQNRALLIDYFQENELLINNNKLAKVKRNKRSKFDSDDTISRGNSKDNTSKSNKQTAT